MGSGTFDKAPAGAEGIAVLVLVVIDDAVSARAALQRVERGAVEQEDDEAEKKRA